jgi:23S rRNA (adenine2503-C2)-methyltransferase
LFSKPLADSEASVTSAQAPRGAVPMPAASGLRIAQLREALRALGAGPLHEARVMRLWTHALAWDSPRKHPADHLPRSLDSALPAIIATLDNLARLQVREPSHDDEGERLLFELADGQTVESVLLARGGVCVSTQVGCAVGCTFCMTGRSGLLRQLGSAEIVAQVVQARRLRPIRKVVFMGMGEPAHNLDNVLEAIEVLGIDAMIGHRNLVFSTVGDVRVFERLPQGRVRPALALSLHSTRAELRASLLPRAPRIDPADLVAAAQTYGRTIGYPVQYQWTLIEGVNDTDEEIDGIVRLLAGQYAVMNLIPLNAIPDSPYRRPSWERAATMARTLHQRGVLTKLRRSAAQDVEGGCGQLRARTITVHQRPAAGRAAAAPAGARPAGAGGGVGVGGGVGAAAAGA